MFTKVIPWLVSSETAVNNFSSEGFQNLSISNTSLNFLANTSDAWIVLADKPSAEELVAGENTDTLSASSSAVKFNAKIGPLDKLQ